MEAALAVITIATFVKDLVELGSKIKDSIDQVGENKEDLSNLGDEVTGTLDGLTTLTQGFENMQPSLELLNALMALKNHLESIHDKCSKISQRTSRSRLRSWGKSWWNRQQIAREIKRLNALKKACQEQFTLFCAARTEGKADQIVKTTFQINNTTARIEAADVHIADTTIRIEAETGQIASTAARIEDGTVLIANTTAQIQTDIVQVASTTARIEDGTVLLTDTTARIEQTTDQVQILALQQKLEKWLEHPPNMKRRQDDTQELQHEGTGSWFLDGDQFKGWKEKPGSLWIRGDSGTGKSVLSSMVIRELFNERQPKTAVAYFYFDFRDEKSQRVKIALQSIILQLSAQSSKPYSALEREFKSSQGQTLPTYDKVLGILEELLSDFAHTYIILDALDECNEHQVLVQLITRLRDWTTRSLHLLLTSQPREIFAEPFEDALLVVLTPDITHDDIRQFIDSELHQLSHLTRRMCAKEIVAKVVKKSNGMFRLAALLLIELRDAFNPDLHAILTSFPDNLFGVYSRFLQRIHPTAVFYVSAVLRWLAFSSEPVTMACLEDALAFDFSNPSQFVYDLLRRGENADRVCKMLEGMIAVKEQWSWKEGNIMVMTLAHASVEDYFRSEKFGKEYPGYGLRAGPSHRFLAQTCLGYLLQFADRPLISETRTDYPLGPYAAKYWHYHLHRSDNPALLSALGARLLQDGSSQYAAFRRHLWDRLPVTKPLSVCSAIGSTEAVRFLLRNGADPNANDDGTTALRKACTFGRLDIVHILLQSGAKVDVMALKEACVHVRRDIFEVLLQEISLSVVHKWITDELVIACTSEYPEIVGFGVNKLEGMGILLETWINLGSPQVPHHLVVSASERGRSDIVRLLLKHGADVNAATEEYNALGAALLHDHIDTIRVLLEKGAEVNVTSGIYGSALRVASHWGDIESVQLLIEHGARVNAAGGEYGSALQAASLRGNMEISRLLLENGADVNATSGIYGNALQAASNRGKIKSVRLLIEHGAEVNAAGGEYGSALQAAAVVGNLDICRLLLENGAGVNAVGGRFGSALQAASFRGNMEIVQLLLENGAEVNAAGGRYGSALQAASANGYVAVVRLLLEQGADVNAFGGFALKAAARLGRLYRGNSWEVEQITRMLLEHGAHEEDVDAHEEDALLDYFPDSCAVVFDDEDAMLDSSSDDSPPSESDD